MWGILMEVRVENPHLWYLIPLVLYLHEVPITIRLRLEDAPKPKVATLAMA